MYRMCTIFSPLSTTNLCTSRCGEARSRAKSINIPRLRGHAPLIMPAKLGIHCPMHNLLILVCLRARYWVFLYCTSQLTDLRFHFCLTRYLCKQYPNLHSSYSSRYFHWHASANATGMHFLYSGLNGKIN